MTEMPIEHAAHAALAPPQPHGAAARLRDIIPVLDLIATRQGGRLIDALARATAAGVPDAEVEGFIAGLHGLAHHHEGLARQNGSGPQPAFTPAHPEDTDGST